MGTSASFMITARKVTNQRTDKNETSHKPVVVGLVGGVASGKSTVARLFAELGARVIDADKIAHDALERPDVCEKLRESWGDEPFDGAGLPDRARIAAIVFGDAEKLQLLNQWVHPPTRTAMREQLDAALQDDALPMVVIDAPLLLEAGLDAWCDLIIFVAADISCRAKRAMKDRHWNEAEIRRREAHQNALEGKRRQADKVIENHGSLGQTRARVAEFYRELTGTSVQETL
jgi:dephospho-CoA kinase